MHDSVTRQRPASDSYDKNKVSINAIALQKSEIIHEGPVQVSGAPIFDRHSEGQVSVNNAGEAGTWDPRLKHSDTTSLGTRRVEDPRHLPDTVASSTQEVSNDAVVLVSPSSISRKRSTSGSDSVMVSIPFQVQGQPTTTRAEPKCSDPWSSSVSVCVPFQVTDGQEVRALPLSASPTRSRPTGSYFGALAGDLPEYSKPQQPAGNVQNGTKPVPTKPSPETEPSRVESIFSRDFREAPKTSVEPAGNVQNGTKPVPTKPTPETEPSRVESIFSRDFREAPKTSVEPAGNVQNGTKPVPTRPTQETEPSRVESILSRDFREAPKTSVESQITKKTDVYARLASEDVWNILDSSSESDKEVVDGAIDKNSILLNSEPPDPSLAEVDDTDGNLGTKVRAHSTPKKLLHSRGKCTFKYFFFVWASCPY